MTRIGVISDTHGLVRPEALAALQGVERILHAGDVGRPEVLEALAGIAPVEAVRGNVDREPWSQALPSRRTVEVGGRRILLLHDVGELDGGRLPEAVEVVVHGHSHQPRNEHAPDGVLYFNPGSAGPRRFHLPICLGLLEVGEGGVRGRIVELVRPR